MKEPCITIYDSKRMGILIYKVVADQFNLTDNQIVSDEVFRKVLEASCDYNLAICELNLAIQEEFDQV